MSVAESEYYISKKNRINLQEADRKRQVTHPSTPFIDRPEKRKNRDKRIGQITQKARKKSKGLLEEAKRKVEEMIERGGDN